jgi:hypothetical protein
MLFLYSHSRAGGNPPYPPFAKGGAVSLTRSFEHLNFDDFLAGALTGPTEKKT